MVLILYSQRGLLMDRIPTDKILLSLIAALMTFAVTFLKEMADSVNRLNGQMAVVIERMATYDARIEKIERKIDASL